MTAILVIGVDRPAFSEAFARHGGGDDGNGNAPVAALVRAGIPAPLCPALVEAPDVATAISLLDTIEDVVLASDPDALVAARLAALVRRSAGRLVRIEDLLIDPAARRVTRAGVELRLLAREYQLLLHLGRHAGYAVSRRALLAEVWGLSFDPGTNVVEVQVSRLRGKLHGLGAPILFTDKGAGYRLGASSRLP